jgi:hypothetical protein
MASKGYTTEADVENYILHDIDETFSAQLDTWISGVEQMIEKLTGRVFIADDTATARVFDGDGTPELLIDDAIAVTIVESGLDEYGSSFQTVAATGADRYFLEPNNYAAKGLPITKVSLSARSFSAGKQNNRVTAKWGYSEEVPDAIKFAATVFVAGILNQHRQGGDEIKSESIGNYSVTYNSDSQSNSWADFDRAKEILQSYRKLNI